MASGRLKYAFLLLGIAMWPGNSVAQESDARDLIRLSIEDLARVRLSTASRHLEDPRKAPSAVTVIDGEEISRYGWRTLGDLLRSVTGFYTAYDRTYTYVGVRGFLQSGDYNARVLLLIDGHRVNENVYDSALIGTEFPLDLSLIDRVEIVRGPGSSLFGTNAELAVINVFTRRPEGRTTVEAAAEDGSFLGRSGELRSAFRIGDFDALVSGSMYRSNGVPHLFFPDYNSPATNNGEANDIDGDRYDHLFGVVQRGQLHIEGLFGTRDKIIPNASYGTIFGDPGNRSIDTRGYLDASYSREYGTDTQLDIRTYYDAYRFFGSYPYADSSPSGRSVQINDAAADWVGGEAVLGRKLGRHRIVAGASGEYNLRIHQRNYYLGQAPLLDDHRHRTLAATFGEAELNPNPKISLNLGGRLDWYSSFGWAISPRIALMYLPTSKTSVKYIFSRAFRAPDPYDQYYVDDLDITATAQSLQPEHIQSHNLVLEHSLAPWLKFSASGFENDLYKTIEEGVDPVTGTTHFANEKGEAGHGFEFEAIAKLASGWSGRSSFTATRTVPKDPTKAVMNSPSDLAKLSGSAPISSHGLLGLELLYAGPQTNYQGMRIPSSFLTNATISTRPLRSGWQFSASCYNLLDRSWATPTGPEVEPAATVQDGRTLRFRITYRHNFERK
jgi:outer membrane receptor for ferrienterochelin and colicins